MKTGDRYPSSKRFCENVFGRRRVLHLSLLVVLCILFSACFKTIRLTSETSESHLLTSHIREGSPLNLLLSYLKLSENDLMVASPTLQNDPFRLDKVDVLLKHPLQIASYADYLTKRIEAGTVSLEKLLSLAVDELEIDTIDKSNKVLPSAYVQHDGDNLFPHIDQNVRDAILTFIAITTTAHREMNEAFSLLSPPERAFLKHYFSEMILMDKTVFSQSMTPHPRAPSPTPLKRDEHYTLKLSFDLASRIERAKLYHASLTIAAAIDTLLKKKKLLSTLVSPNGFKEDNNLRGDIIAYEETPWGAIIIGGKGPTYYNKITPLLIIDLGGNDEYHNIAPFANTDPSRISSSIIIDFEGNDIYRSDSELAHGSGSFGFGCLVDLAGNDTYLSYDFSQGCGFFGVGILYDRNGDDRYRSDVMGQGAGAFGVGLLCDLGGNDSYFGNLYNQGLGFVGGMGLLIDAAGNDIFVAGEKYPDFREPDLAFDSFSQGFGLGYRNYGSGGIGVLWDAHGNDRYKSSYFSQGSSYWRALGLLIDTTGNDTYGARRYAQGAGTHSTVGALIDESGDDAYTSWGISQGCGYDYSQGMLFDKKGDDTYRAEWFSQGSSGVAGVGMLIDTYGNDTYQCEPFNSQGSGQYSEKEASGSIGLLMDLQGEDTYAHKGKNNSLWRQGDYGGGIDTRKAVWPNTITPWAPDPPLMKGTATLPQPISLSLPHNEPLTELEGSLDNEDFRKVAVKNLSERGPAIIPQLIDYLHIGDSLLTVTVMAIVKKMGNNAVPPLLAALDDASTDSVLTTSLLSVLAEMEDENLLSTFMSFLKADNPEHRKMAMRGLSRLKGALPPEEILPCADDTSPAVRKYCARALEGNDTPAALKELTRLLVDDHFSVRFAAFESLRMKGGTSEPYLLQILDNAASYPPYTRDLAVHLIETLRTTQP